QGRQNETGGRRGDQPMVKQTLAALVLILVTISETRAGYPPQKSKELLVDRVRKSMDRGIQFLRDQEKGRGNWEVDQLSFLIEGGWTSLALLALLNAGVPPDDPIIDRGLRYLRTVQPKNTYVDSLQAMVFAEAGRTEDRVRIQRNVNWLIQSMIRDQFGK